LVTDDDKFEAKLAQYNRFAEDWRHVSSLIWQIPSIAIAIMTGIIGVSFQFLDGVPRIVLLGIGAFFLLAICVALAKHRLFHESRSVFMRDLERNFGITVFPTEGKQTKNYLNKSKLKGAPISDSNDIPEDNFTNFRLYNWLSSKRSAIWLLFVMFIAFLILLILSFLSTVQFLGIVDLNDILGAQINNTTKIFTR
jgi:hypothetical protein